MRNRMDLQQDAGIENRNRKRNRRLTGLFLIQIKCNRKSYRDPYKDTKAKKRDENRNGWTMRGALPCETYENPKTGNKKQTKSKLRNEHETNKK